MKKIAQEIEKCIGADRLETTEFQVHDTDHKVKCAGCALHNTVCPWQCVAKNVRSIPGEPRPPRGGGNRAFVDTFCVTTLSVTEVIQYSFGDR
jgi:hypothetical protein